MLMRGQGGEDGQGEGDDMKAQLATLATQREALLTTPWQPCVAFLRHNPQHMAHGTSGEI